VRKPNVIRSNPAYDLGYRSSAIGRQKKSQTLPDLVNAGCNANDGV
jgi:hypothetical protein